MKKRKAVAKLEAAGRCPSCGITVLYSSDAETPLCSSCLYRKEKFGS